MLKKFIADLKKEFEGYNGQGLSKDIMAGITVAAVALPLALAFGVSSGADAAAGLVTAIIAGIVIGGLSGASYQISGPTGAMAAILMGLSATHGISGVLTAGLFSGVILLIVALLRADKLVSYIPSPVITGFTSGIAIIIALGQIDNFFGTTSEGTSALLKLASYARLGFSPELMSVIFGGAVVAIMLIYPKKWQKYFPSSLFSLIVVLVVNLIMFPEKGVVAEVGAIPKSLMTPEALLIKGIDFKNIASYIAPAISVAALGMVESLLCGTSASKMKNGKFDSRRELVAQGVGNVIIPLLGGVPATAAIARTSVAIKSGGKTRLVSVFHSVTLILSMFLLSGVMSRIPLCALAGVLMVTAWRMNEWDEIKKIFKNRYKAEIAQFLITMVATVVFDLTVAIVIGVAFSMFMFVVKSCDLTVNISKVNLDVTKEKGIVGSYKYTKIVYLAGPMFFGTQDKLTKALEQIEDDTCDIIFSMRGVPSVDSSALEELSEICEEFRRKDVRVLFCGVNDKVMKTLDSKGFKAEIGEENFLWDAVSAIKKIEKEVFVTE
ncbi:MAG: SulP family inorganic anion transporter [Clostridia bacterium]|nr:SulP family inorganic anion transporter [Clostridia bacterium]